MALSLVVQGKGLGLSRVVKQGCPPQCQIPGHLPHHMGGVGIHIVGVVAVMLQKAHHGGKLRHRLGKNRAEGEQILPLCQQKNLAHLGIDPLPGKGVEGGGKLHHGSHGLRPGGKAVPEGKAHAS